MLERVVKTTLKTLLVLAGLSFAVGILTLYLDFWMWLSSDDLWGAIAGLSLFGFAGIFLALWTKPSR